MVWDFLALFPFQELGLLRTGYNFRLTRILKLKAVFNIMDDSGIGVLMTRLVGAKDMKLKRRRIYEKIGRFIEVSLSLAMATYVLACYAYWHTDNFDDWPEEYDEHFLEDSEKMQNKDDDEKLLTMQYFILTTLTQVGYGDLYPLNPNEYGPIIIVMLIGISVWAFVISRIRNMAAKIWSSNPFDQYMNELFTWLDRIEIRHGRINPEIKRDVLNHSFYFL